jgi:hypothetical protein
LARIRKEKVTEMGEVLLKKESPEVEYCKYLEHMCRNSSKLTPREANKKLICKEVALQYGCNPDKIKFDEEGNIVYGVGTFSVLG